MLLSELSSYQLFTDQCLQNHIVHHTLTLFALGASPSEIQAGYDANTSYQRPHVPTHGSTPSSLSDPEKFKSCLGKEKNYSDFLTFFSSELDTKGTEAVLNEYLFANDARADDLLIRMYAGFLHPIIHLGFGVEFEQPAIIAEALAQAAVHDSWIGTFLEATSKHAKLKRGKADRKKTIVQILEECRADEKLKSAPHYDDGNKIRDGILKRAPNEMANHASDFTVGESEEELKERCVEMISAAGMSCLFPSVLLYPIPSHSIPSYISFPTTP